jgi:hexosaminidase
MAFPRLCALAEAVWMPAEGRDYADFLARLKEHLQRLDGMNVHYRRLD